jgi:hypothetical protein
MKRQDWANVYAFFTGVRYSKRLDKKKVIAAIAAQRLYADAPDGAEYKDLRRKLLNECVRLSMLCSAEGYGEVQNSSIADWEAGRLRSKSRASIACA